MVSVIGFLMPVDHCATLLHLPFCLTLGSLHPLTLPAVKSLVYTTPNLSFPIRENRNSEMGWDLTA